MRKTVCRLLAASLLLLGATPSAAEERTVVGIVTKADAAARVLAVKDEMGVRWNFKIDPKAGIDISDLKAGDKVRVDIGRATPRNMMSAADTLRRGDKVTRIRGR